jgi:AraC family transcriptional regulator of arabinose operon
MAFIINSCQLDNLTLGLKWSFLREKPGEWEFEWYAPHTVIWLVIRGERKFLIEAQSFEVREGDLIAMKPDQHVQICSSREPFVFYALAVDAKVGDIDFCELYQLPTVTAREQLDDCGQLLKLWDELTRTTVRFSALTDDRESEEELILNSVETLVRLQLQQLLHSWFTEYYRLMLPKLPNSPVQFDSRVMMICKYIQGHIKGNVTLHSLAKEFYLSPSHLNVLFRKSLGQSPMTYVRTIRMRSIRDMLARTSYSIKEIAELHGFPTQSEFSRLFRRHTGITPSNYRKKFKRMRNSF